MKAVDVSNVDTNGSTTERTEAKHFVIGAFMILAGLVSGFLSYKGANAIFESHMLSIPFAVVVQGAIFVALWHMPKQSVVVKLLLAIVWAIAASFSIGSAYLETTAKAYTSTEILAARNDLLEFVAGVSAVGASLKDEIAIQEDNAAAEIDDQRVKDNRQGPKYREFKNAAAKAQLEYEAYERSAGAAIQRIQDDLADPEKSDDLNDLRIIWERHQAGVSSKYRTGVATPVFVTKETSPTSRLAALWALIMSEATSEAKQFEISLALLWASLMEALALLLAIVRLVTGLERDPRSLGERLVDSIASIKQLKHVLQLASEQNEITLRNHRVRLEERRREVEARESLLPSSKRSKRSNAGTKPKRSQSPSVSMWRDAICWEASHSKIDEEALIRKALVVDGKLDQKGEESFDEKQFAGLGIIRTALIETKVIVREKRGYRRGQNWSEWIRFLLNEATPKKAQIHTLKRAS
ncbi:MAG: hypothetical protein AAF662_02955 [Pseudomonadota bacterium]